MWSFHVSLNPVWTNYDNCAIARIISAAFRLAIYTSQSLILKCFSNWIEQYVTIPLVTIMLREATALCHTDNNNFCHLHWYIRTSAFRQFRNYLLSASQIRIIQPTIRRGSLASMTETNHRTLWNTRAQYPWIIPLFNILKMTRVYVSNRILWPLFTHTLITRLKLHFGREAFLGRFVTCNYIKLYCHARTQLPWDILTNARNQMRTYSRWEIVGPVWMHKFSG
jgi:hypothetical protein